MLLAIDTSLNAVSLCVTREGEFEPLALKTAFMQKGHAEALMPMLQELLSDHRVETRNIQKIAVAVGPGSYTGMRIGIAAAKSMGLVFNVPVVGVSTLAALAAPLRLQGEQRPIVSVIDARNGNIYLQIFMDKGASLPELMARESFFQTNRHQALIFVGPAAKQMAELATNFGQSYDYKEELETIGIAYVARLGWLADVKTAPPLPLYLNTPHYKKIADS
jgi:tRNA threonylcarbamoyladenosine biosynthesis protein TsaB